MESNQSNKTLIAVAILVGGLLVGGGTGYAVGAMNSTKSDTGAAMTASAAPTTTTKAADLRAALVSLGEQHMIYTKVAVDDALGGSKGADASGKALYDNGNAIGAAVGSVYGKDAETTFDSVWKLHLDQFVAYAVAGSKKDETGKAAALASIDANYTKPLSAYLAKANPKLPEATLYSLLSDHVAMTAKMIDYRNAGDYAGEQTELDLSTKHIDGIFSALANGIVAQFPDKFKG